LMDERAFFGHGEDRCLHSLLMRFVAGSK
jgi:hypothetical protein